MKTARLRRALLKRIIHASGLYAVSGNHVFLKAELLEITNHGRFYFAVLEQPQLHPEWVVRAAGLLQRTF